MVSLTALNRLLKTHWIIQTRGDLERGTADMRSMANTLRELASKSLRTLRERIVNRLPEDVRQNLHLRVQQEIHESPLQQGDQKSQIQPAEHEEQPRSSHDVLQSLHLARGHSSLRGKRKPGRVRGSAAAPFEPREESPHLTPKAPAKSPSRFKLRMKRSFGFLKSKQPDDEPPSEPMPAAPDYPSHTQAAMRAHGSADTTSIHTAAPHLKGKKGFAGLVKSFGRRRKRAAVTPTEDPPQLQLRQPDSTTQLRAHVSDTLSPRHASATVEEAGLEDGQPRARISDEVTPRQGNVRTDEGTVLGLQLSDRASTANAPDKRTVVADEATVKRRQHSAQHTSNILSPEHQVTEHTASLTNQPETPRRVLLPLDIPKLSLEELRSLPKFPTPTTETASHDDPPSPKSRDAYGPWITMEEFRNLRRSPTMPSMQASHAGPSDYRNPRTPTKTSEGHRNLPRDSTVPKTPGSQVGTPTRRAPRIPFLSPEDLKDLPKFPTPPVQHVSSQASTPDLRAPSLHSLRQSMSQAGGPDPRFPIRRTSTLRTSTLRTSSQPYMMRTPSQQQDDEPTEMTRAPLTRTRGSRGSQHSANLLPRSLVLSQDDRVPEEANSDNSVVSSERASYGTRGWETPSWGGRPEGGSNVSRRASASRRVDRMPSVGARNDPAPPSTPRRLARTSSATHGYSPAPTSASSAARHPWAREPRPRMLGGPIPDDWEPPMPSRPAPQPPSHRPRPPPEPGADLPPGKTLLHGLVRTGVRQGRLPPPDQDDASQVARLPTEENDFGGFCEGAYWLQMGQPEKAYRAVARPVGFASRQDTYIECRHCRYWIAADPAQPDRTLSAGTRVLRALTNTPSGVPARAVFYVEGIQYRAAWLLRSHAEWVEKRRPGKPWEGRFRCLFCCAEGRRQPLLLGGEQFLEHLQQHRWRQPHGAVLLGRAAALVGRPARNTEQFDIVLPPSAL